MRKLLFVLLTLVVSAIAADVTGSWSGPMKMKMGDDVRDDTALLILKQSGAAITGSIGPNEERRYEISKGTIDGNNVHIEAVMQGENKLILDLKVDGDKLTGELKAQGPDAPPLSGTLALEKKK